MEEKLNIDPNHPILIEIKKQKILWKIFMCLPVLYLLICEVINKWYFIPNGIWGFFHLKKDTFKILLLISIFLAFVSEVSIVALKRRYFQQIKEILNKTDLVISKMRTMFFILACFCDTTSGLGLILFLLNGEIWVMALFGIIGLILYAQIIPNERIIEDLQKTSPFNLE